MSKTEYTRFLGTLANKDRFSIIQLLYREGPLNVTQIYKKLKFKQSTVSNHLKRLSSCNYVFLKPNGQERIYELNKQTIVPLMKLIDKHVSNYCPNCAN